jgi:thymidine phosphorylase
MSTPLGRSAGNAVEVAESLEVLGGGGPADLVEVTVALAREMATLAGLDGDPAVTLTDGSALAKWAEIVRAQGGDPDAPLPEATTQVVVPAPVSGFLQRLDAYRLGVAAWRLGAGRSRKEDAVSATAGVVWHATIGEEVVRGEPLLTLHVDDAARLDRARQALDGAFDIGAEPPPSRTLVIERIA